MNGNKSDNKADRGKDKTMSDESTPTNRKDRKMMTRQEHLQWCKDRALEYLERGDVAGGMASFISDMTKHPETNETLEMTRPLIVRALITQNPSACIECVNGFN